MFVEMLETLRVQMEVNKTNKGLFLRVLLLAGAPLHFHIICLLLVLLKLRSETLH